MSFYCLGKYWTSLPERSRYANASIVGSKCTHLLHFINTRYIFRHSCFTTFLTALEKVAVKLQIYPSFSVFGSLRLNQGKTRLAANYADLRRVRVVTAKFHRLFIKHHKLTSVFFRSHRYRNTSKKNSVIRKKKKGITFLERHAEEGSHTALAQKRNCTWKPWYHSDHATPRLLLTWMKPRAKVTQVLGRYFWWTKITS